MEQSEFDHNMSGAKEFATLAEESTELNFWIGYQRGMRRHYHGEKFGTDEEHTLWMSLAETLGTGYRAGYSGMSISDAIEHLAE